MAAKFYQRTLTSSLIPNLTRSYKAKFFIASPGDFTIDATKRKSASTWGDVYGTNASFFMDQNYNAGYAAYMTALHVVNNKSIEEATNNKSYIEGGSSNTQAFNNTATAIDFLYYTGSTVGIKGKTASWSSSNNRGIPTIKWAVGGYNLLADTYIKDKATFDKKLEEYYTKITPGNMKRDVETSRTLIGYRGNNQDVILVTVTNNSSGNYWLNGPKLHDCHLIMRYFGCTMALCLDGSNATQIRYKENGANKSIDAQRCPWARIRLTTTAANNCDWTGT